MSGSVDDIANAYKDLGTKWQSCVLVVAFGALFLLLELSMTHSPIARLIAKLLESNPKLESYAQNKGSSKEVEVKRCTPMVVTRIVGFIHNSIQVPIAVWAICNPELRHDRLYGTFPLTHYMLCAAGGFFLHDAVSCLMRESPFYVVHGLTCCAGYTLGAAFGCGHFYGGLFLMWEVSTPFVQLRWILQKMGRIETALYKANGALMFLSFGVARILFGTYFTGLLVFDTYTELRHPTAGQHQPKAIFVGFCAAALTISCLNYYWFSQMCAIVTRVLRKTHNWTEVSEGKEE